MIQNNGTLKTLHGSELIKLVRSYMETTFQIVVGVYLPAITPDLAEMESVVQDVCMCARRGRHRLQNLALLASESGLPCFPCRVSSRLSPSPRLRFLSAGYPVNLAEPQAGPVSAPTTW